ncbi:MAG: rhomboid family intramembrane serine protease [Deferribacteres bacterium]|nr:rhomboid family intramembrane serine protease [candidate division KSB1 bacterium]MCB9503975.1 rhomboid family intramembrane serine protease [Deferribacteres bacterium]
MNYQTQRFHIGLGPGMTPMVRNLIFINIGIYIIQNIAIAFLNIDFNGLFGLVPVYFLHNLFIWQIVTYLFLHGSILHIFLNMLILWMFGVDLEREWGGKAFLKYYLICGIGAGLFQILFNMLFFPENQAIPIIGASGAIYGVILAFALMYPERELTFLVFFVLPVRIKAKYLAMILAGISLFSGVFGTDNAVAHFAHLGGMFVGLLYLKFDWQMYSIAAHSQRRRQAKQMIKQAKRRQKEEEIRAEMDAILDKINEVGYENLTRNEQETLRKASQYLNEEQ